MLILGMSSIIFIIRHGNCTTTAAPVTIRKLLDTSFHGNLLTFERAEDKSDLCFISLLLLLNAQSTGSYNFLSHLTN